MSTSPARVARFAAMVLCAGVTLAAASGVASAAPVTAPAQLVLPAPIFPQDAANEGEYYYVNYFYTRAGRGVRPSRIPDTLNTFPAQ